MMTRAVAISSLAVMGLGGCAEQPTGPHFAVIDRLMIDDDLINILVETGGVTGPEMASDYADCVVAAYALENQLAFARPIRTQTTKTGGNWRADAVYSVSPALPKGPRTIDAEIAVQGCAELGIPTS